MSNTKLCGQLSSIAEIETKISNRQIMPLTFRTSGIKVFYLQSPQKLALVVITLPVSLDLGDQCF